LLPLVLPPKRLRTFTGPHGIKFKKTVTVVTFCNLTTEHCFGKVIFGGRSLTFACSLLFLLLFDVEDGASPFLRNVGEFLLNYIIVYPRRQHYS
jgi:hypothetical protein